MKQNENMNPESSFELSFRADSEVCSPEFPEGCISFSE